MNQLVFESEASPETHVFAGMWRPPLSNVCNGVSGCLHVVGGGTYWTQEQIRTGWMNGDFDRPLYKKIIE